MENKIRKIMFVCHGNICRSPMAEFVLKNMLAERGVLSEFTVSSSATSTEEIWGNIGNPVYPPARAELLKHGISCEGKRAVQLKKADYENYDLFLAMDDANVRNIHLIFGTDPDNKVKKLMSYTSRGGSVLDPWYTRDFAATYRDVFDACTALIGEIL